MNAVIYHNPACGTSRRVLQRLEEAGLALQVHDYRARGWERAHLSALLEAMGKRPRDVLRVRGTPASDLGLTDPAVGDDEILDAMVAHPILVERPIVTTDKGTRLCRPADEVEALL